LDFASSLFASLLHVEIDRKLNAEMIRQIDSESFSEPVLHKQNVRPLPDRWAVSIVELDHPAYLAALQPAVRGATQNTAVAAADSRR
jgi:hypothetical protein